MRKKIPMPDFPRYPSPPRSDSNLKSQIRPSGVYLLSEAGMVLDASRSARVVLGYRPEDELNGQDWRQWLDASSRPLVERDILPSLAATGAWHGSLAFRRADDRTIIELSVALQTMSSGSLLLALRDPVSLAALERDRSELKEQFHQAMTMQAIGRLAGSVAHEFNNLLAASLGYSEMLVEDLPEGSPQHRFAAKIHLASERARKLVQQLLTFARPQDAPEGSLDLNAVFAEVAQLMQATMPPQIGFSFHSTSDALVINGNFGHMSQLLMHLVGNARDAIGRENGKIDVTLGRIAAEPLAERFHAVLESQEDRPWLTLQGNAGQSHRIIVGRPRSGAEYAFLRVEDSGSGMTFDVLSHMFEPFFTTRNFGAGSGLGLSAVHGIVASLGGLIDVETTSGKGTAFSVFLPMS
jgi:signal transduction histidine kinase